jgi:hypothetical protein
MVSDPYTQAKTLAQTLRARNMDDWSLKIDDIVTGGSTSTEILMGLRWVIQELLNGSTPLDPDAEALARSLIREVNELLK